MNFTLIIYNVVFIAFPLAIIEIIIEKDKGWGSGWDKDKWYARKFLEKNRIFRWVATILKIEHPLNYHFVVFGIVIPILLVAQYFLLVQNVFLYLSTYIAILISEDFLWFLLNWNFNSFKELTKGPKGSIWWHKNWVHIHKNYYLPTIYFIGLVLVFFLYCLA